MDIRFCDRCTESIPDVEFDAGRAVSVDGRNYHVACAMARTLALTGPRAWLAFVLALYAAGVATFLLVVALRGDAGVAAPVEARIREAAAAAGRDAVEKSSLQLDAVRRQDAAAFAGVDALHTLRDQMDRGLGSLSTRVQENERLADERMKGLGKDIEDLRSHLDTLSKWMEEVAEAAKARAQREAAAEPAVEPTPPPTEPEPEADPPARTPPSPETDPAHQAEVDRWIERLGDDNENIRFSATLELGRLKSLRATEPLVAVLADDRDYYVRLGAATALGDIKAVAAIPALVEALDDGDALVRTAANDALKSITAEDIEFRSDMSRTERRRAQTAWKQWFETNEGALRRRLGQPK